jgi:5-formyltetrahydrofolate cyclo-ligase
MSFATDASAKAALRLAMRGRRRQFVREHPDADWRCADMAERMLDGLFGSEPRTGVAALYHASGFEIDAAPLGEALRAMGWRIALPASEVVDAPVVFRGWGPGEPLAPDAVGIAAPLASAPELRPDIVIAPLIAFDRTGGRLGQGGGYYDRTLAGLRAGPKPPAFVGLAFSIQEVAHVPMEPHDQRLDAILTEKAFIPVAKDS